MNYKFSVKIENIPPLHEKLMSSSPIEEHRIDKSLEIPGVYLFSEAGRALYVGMSRNIRRRYKLHTNENSTQNQSSFAFKLAKEIMNSEHPGSVRRVTRGELARDLLFMRYFSEAKMRIKSMDFRAVAVSDPVWRTLLETYVAIVCDTPYNDFETH